MVDADTRLAPNALCSLVRPFADAEVGACSGRVHVESPRGVLGHCQALEYAIANGVERRLFATFGVMTCVPGAIGAFRRSALLSIGGFPADTVAEDTDVTLTLQQHGWRIGYEPLAEAWTRPPDSWSGLFRQRVRWSLGVIQNVRKHGRVVPPKASFAFRLMVPYLAFFSGIAVLAPLVDALAIYHLLHGDLGRSAWITGISLTLMSLVAAAAIRLEGDRWRLIGLLPLHVTMYRVVLYIAQLRAIQAWIAGVHVRWRARRRGEERSVELAAVPEFHVLANP